MNQIPVRQINNVTYEPVLAGNFNIRVIDVTAENGDMTESLHRHDFFYVLALKKAAGSHQIDFVNYPVADNTVFLMRPGQVHQLTLNAGSNGYLLQFRSDFLYAHNLPAKALLRKVSHKHNCPLEKPDFDRLIPILENITNEYTDKREGYEEVIRSGMNIFMVELLRHRKNREADQNGDNQYQQEKLEHFFSLLEDNITEMKSASQYADMLNLSAFQLNSLTKKLLGKSPSDIINDQIILEAKRQLLATSGLVSQIAYDLGYDDPSYFIRFFKKHTGKSPEAFRTSQ
jgi:AraC-like DNA-binding protein